MCSKLKSLSQEKDSLWSWFVCVLAALCNALHFGVSLSFGVILPYLLQHMKESIDMTAMVGSLAIGVTFVASLPASKLIDYIGLRGVTFLGGLTCVVSLILTSFAHSIAVLYVTYSIGFGVGAGFLYTASMMLTNAFFKRHRNLAIGVICAGGGSGYLAFGPLLQLSLDTYDWKQTFRLLGAVFALPVSFSILFGSDSKKRAKKKDEENEGDSRPCKVFDWSILKNSLYTVSVASITLGCLGHYILQIYVVELCEKLGIPPSKSSQLLIYVGFATIITRVLAGIVQNSLRVTTQCVFQLAVVLDAIVQVSVPYASKYEHFIVLCILYGIADGGFTTSLNGLLLSTVKPEQVSTAFGFGCLINAIAVASGAPLAGLLIKRYNSHNPAFFVCAGILVLAALLLFLHRCIVSLSSRDQSMSRINAEASTELCPSDKDRRLQLLATPACSVTSLHITYEDLRETRL